MNPGILKVLVLFLLIYAGLFIFSNVVSQVPVVSEWLPVKHWEFNWDVSRLDYMLWFVPIASFFFVYFLIPFARQEFGFGKTFEQAFPVIFLVACYFAYFVAVYWYYDNVAFLNNVKLSDLGLDFINPFGKEYWLLFAGSHFFYFVLGGIGGWLARAIIQNFEPQEKQ